MLPGDERAVSRILYLTGSGVARPPPKRWLAVSADSWLVDRNSLQSKVHATSHNTTATVVVRTNRLRTLKRGDRGGDNEIANAANASASGQIAARKEHAPARIRRRE
jgi:hypothetical protein